MNIAIIFAGGSGVRMGAGVPKQFLEINGKPIIVHTLQLFQYHDQIDKIYISVLKEYVSYMKELVEEYRLKKTAAVIEGGETAQDSIYNALKRAAAENSEDSIVLLHDGVRPFVSYDVIADNIRGVKEYGNAITCTACYETILLSKDGDQVDSVPYRRETFAAQAPQSFYLKDIIAAHDVVRARPEGYENMVDACTILKSQGLDVHMIPGNRGNIKVTTPEDVYMYRALLNYKENEQAFGLGLTNRMDAKRHRD
ncbi:MAG: 2-C-methyl-D-erythritol 4-phosphate cytidylyltransferase [Muribaculaceae bacterium]|nr:2-C-methyl-D-erythritol 4-phosphate cytidylyltransferase [Roseburia sp.]MCM1431814.1 2-C-methyl-D-erythritol 4-phosphate cytidylyltransferase [Muribaculaceae bacterium]MCM1493495.1 2-C-methyl-D-erythritol 4-phosphate cytidylyltransferase [Muribaculaceae bacterium]